jgi:probable rRNA maturation factor
MDDIDADRRTPGPGGSGPVVLVANRQDLPVDQEELAGVAERVLRAEGCAEGELSLALVDPTEMEDLHRRFMGERGPTDVLSFAMGEDGLLGDVVVCPEVARSNNPDLAAELRLLVAHGVLHLLGYDHEEEDERRVMWEKQDRYSGGGR